MVKTKGIAVACLTLLMAAGAGSGAKGQQRNSYVRLLPGSDFITDWEMDRRLTVPPAPALPVVIETGAGFGIGAALGYTFSFGLSVRGELTFRLNSIDDLFDPVGGFKFRPFRVATDGSIRTLSIVLRGLYSIRVGQDFLDGRLSPYVGAGVGLALPNGDSQGNVLGIKVRATDDSDVTFAYQFVIGFDYTIAPDIRIGLNYRFLDATNAMLEANEAAYGRGGSVDLGGRGNHTIMMRLRWRFRWTGADG